jgi:hypothetical protein
MIEEALKTKVLSDSDVGGAIGQRLYIKKLPQNPTLPAVTYSKVSGPRHHDLDVAYPRYQFDVWAQSYITARNIAGYIRKALQREKGNWSGVKVLQAVFLNEFDDYEPDTELYHYIVEFKIIYRGE